MRGWSSGRFAARFIFYNPADLVLVANGTLKSWQPQPYAGLDIDSHLYRTCTSDVQQFAGKGVQARYLTGGLTFDRAHGIVYLLELFAADDAPIVHVWRLVE